MAKRKTLIDLLDDLTPTVRQAFLDSIARVTSDVQIAALEDAFRRGDAQAIVEIVRMDAEFFAPLDRAIRDAYEMGGDFVMSDLQRMARAQGARVSLVFGANDPSVTRWLQEQSSRRIVEITTDRQAIIQRALADMADAGTSPRTAALNLVGRYDRLTGRRQGGLVGLTSQQSGWADAAYRELVEGDPAYFQRKLRDRRFDRTLAKAIREGRGVSPAEARRIVERYRDGLLRYRGENIARTELLGSLHHAQSAALDQMKRREGLADDAISLTWDAANDAATRDEHRGMDGQVRESGEPFVSPSGYRLKYPGDQSLGAPASMVIQCRCAIRIKVDWISGLRDRLSPEELAEARAAI